MKNSEILSFRTRTATLIDESRLHDAFKAMRSFSEQSMTWEITSSIDRLEQNYAYMLRYMADGATDPGRDDMRRDIASEARALLDTITRRAMMAETATLYFNTARTLSTRSSGAKNIADGIAAVRAERLRLDSDFDSLADPGRASEYERLGRDLFGIIWTTHPFTASDADLLADAMTDPTLPLPLKAMIIAAVGMGAMEIYDDRRLEMLLRAYMNTEADTELNLRALLWYILATFRHRRRKPSRRLESMLEAAADTSMWQSDLGSAAIELMRTRDTERISQRMRDDLMPSLMKLGPELRDKMNDGDIDLEALAEGANPEWDEMMQRDGLADKLKEMSEIQADGGDVYMAAFGHMKHFHFFHDIANWFVPFYPEHSAVAAVDNLEGSIGGLLKQMPFLCDSDKYSLVLSLSSAPGHQREAVSSALSQSDNQMQEMLSEVEKADESTTRKRILNRYTRDIYRFYNLFRRKSDFFNPFAHNVDPLSIDLLGRRFKDIETLRLVAEFEVRHKLWPEAVVQLKRLESLDDPDAMRAQKLAYCLEQLGKTDEALSYYEQADMLDGNSLWTLEHWAEALMHAERYDRAAEVYSRLEEALSESPDSKKAEIAMALGRCYLATARYAEAEQQFYKAQYLNPDATEPVAGLARAHLLSGKATDAIAEFVRSQDVAWSGIIADGTLGAGHASWVSGHMRDAIDYYIMYMAKTGADTDALETAIRADLRYLIDAGADPGALRLIIEAILYAN